LSVAVASAPNTGRDFGRSAQTASRRIAGGPSSHGPRSKVDPTLIRNARNLLQRRALIAKTASGQLRMKGHGGSAWVG